MVQQIIERFLMQTQQRARQVLRSLPRVRLPVRRLPSHLISSMMPHPSRWMVVLVSPGARIARATLPGTGAPVPPPDVNPLPIIRRCDPWAARAPGNASQAEGRTRNQRQRWRRGSRALSGPIQVSPLPTHPSCPKEGDDAPSICPLNGSAIISAVPQTRRPCAPRCSWVKMGGKGLALPSVVVAFRRAQGRAAEVAFQSGTQLWDTYVFPREREHAY